MLVDTGSTENIITQEELNKIDPNNEFHRFHRNICVKGVSGVPLSVLGMADVSVQFTPTINKIIPFIIVQSMDSQANAVLGLNSMRSADILIYPRYENLTIGGKWGEIINFIGADTDSDTTPTSNTQVPHKKRFKKQINNHCISSKVERGGRYNLHPYPTLPHPHTRQPAVSRSCVYGRGFPLAHHSCYRVDVMKERGARARARGPPKRTFMGAVS